MVKKDELREQVVLLHQELMKSKRYYQDLQEEMSELEEKYEKDLVDKVNEAKYQEFVSHNKEYLERFIKEWMMNHFSIHTEYDYGHVQSVYPTIDDMTF